MFLIGVSHILTTKSGFNFHNSYEQLPLFFYTKTKLNPVENPTIVQFNKGLAKDLGLLPDFFQTVDAAQVLSGSKLIDNSLAIAQAYAGHQFGHFTMLGDGRAILLGEQVGKDGHRHDVQLKGSGPTRYSRGGDGRATLGPMLREYLISEAMHALGIPTTRGLAVVSTGEKVMRERPLPGAILTRVSSSHLRVGTFQYAKAWGSTEQLKALADYAISRHDPEILGSDEVYLKFLSRVIGRQAELIAKWQLVGFVHGVMNTDNMTISGETIDYGPCAFLDHYDPETVFSSIDDQGRYAYGNQPYIGKWNLTRFAETLLPLLHDDTDTAVKKAEDALATYDERFTYHFLTGMRHKLGFFAEQDGDADLVHELLGLLEKYRLDYTNFFLQLTFDHLDELGLADKDDFQDWHRRWQKRLQSQAQSDEKVRDLMKKHNPAIIPRNHFVEKALAKAVDENDFSLFEKFYAALSEPYAHTKEQAKFSHVPDTTMPYRTYCGT